ARDEAEPLLCQCLRQWHQFGVGRGAAEQVLGGDRPGLGRYEVQQTWPLGIVLPRAPCGQEVQAQAKPGFQDAPLRLACPSAGQSAAAQKNTAGLFEPAGAGAIDVLKAPAAWRAVRQPLDRFRHYSEGGT